MSSLSLHLDTPELARHYEQASADRQLMVGKALVAKLAPREGERVLDVGTGTGLLAEHVATLVGPSGSVIGIDPLPLRIEIARRKARPNLAFEVGDAYALDAFASDSFDIVYLNAVFHWLPDKATALRQFLSPAQRRRTWSASRRAPATTRARFDPFDSGSWSAHTYSTHPQVRGALGHHVGAAELRAKAFSIRDSRFDRIEPRAFQSNHQPTADAAHRVLPGELVRELPRPPAREPESVRAGGKSPRSSERLRTPQGILKDGQRIVAIAEVKERA